LWMVTKSEDNGARVEWLKGSASDWTGGDAAPACRNARRRGVSSSGRPCRWQLGGCIQDANGPTGGDRAARAGGGRTPTGNMAFAVRLERTTKNKKRTANTLPCVFPGNARQRAHVTFLHGKPPLPCAFYQNARQSFTVR
jgi:hypothetical protein